jgi:hypothetical protein
MHKITLSFRRVNTLYKFLWGSLPFIQRCFYTLSYVLDLETIVLFCNLCLPSMTLLFYVEALLRDLAYR